MTVTFSSLSNAQVNAFTSFAHQGLLLGRVAEEHKHIYEVWTEADSLLAEVSGKLRFSANSRNDFPAVGDFVAIAARPDEGKGTIHGVLPRFSKFVRKAAGATTDEQIVAANVNTVFLVMSLNQDLNLRRLERYLIMAWDSGANPVVVLTKADLCADVESAVTAVSSVAFGVPVHVVSAVDGIGTDGLSHYIGSGQTAAMLGSSGVGKSTLLNQLAGQDIQVVQSVRSDDDKGRHTTTTRTLFALPTGGFIIDTPGMRELQLWDAESAGRSGASGAGDSGLDSGSTSQPGSELGGLRGSGLNGTFSDVLGFAEACQFRDCQHANEPGCMVRQAIEDGRLPAARFASYQKLQRELAYVARKEDSRARMAEQQKWKKITHSQRQRGHRP